MRVVLDPDPEMTGNPYIQLYADALIAAGCDVVGIGRGHTWEISGVLNIHFPDLAAGSRSLARSAWWVAQLHARIERARRAGTSIVWTAHNVRSHDQHHPRLERLFMRRFSSRLDGFTVLSPAQVRTFESAYPALRDIPRAVTPHGHFRGRYSPRPEQATARARLGLPEDAQVLLALGDLRSYKRTTQLAEAFRRTQSTDLRLLVAGRERDPGVVRTVRSAARADPRIILRFGWLSDPAVAEHVAASDVVCVPYGSVLNSSVAMLGLSMGRRVLMPHVPSALALRAEVGAAWVAIGTGSALSPGDLEASVRELPPQEAFPDLSARSWSDIGRTAAEFFCSLRERR